MGYVARGFDSALTPARRAEYISLCDFRVVEPASKGLEPGVMARRTSALTQMRRSMAEQCQVRILFSGKTHGWLGLLPGIAEELLETVRYAKRTGEPKPVLLLEGLGGCAEHLHGFFETGTWPKELTFESEKKWRKRQGSLGDEVWGCVDESDRRDAFEALRDELEDARKGGLVHLCGTENITRILAEIHDWLRGGGTVKPPSSP